MALKDLVLTSEQIRVHRLFACLAALHELLAVTRRKSRSPGLFAQLTPEQQAAVLAFNGPVGSGRSDLPRIIKEPSP